VYSVFLFINRSNFQLTLGLKQNENSTTFFFLSPTLKGGKKKATTFVFQISSSVPAPFRAGVSSGAKRKIPPLSFFFPQP
jgi:hypothetical protein